MLEQLLSDPETWKHASIPFVAALVGWGTNWVAIKLTFYPVEHMGWRPFPGWQGIIPSKAEKMGATFVDTTMHRLGSLGEVFDEMEPDKIAAHIIRTVEPKLDGLIDEVVEQHHAELWSRLPEPVRQNIYNRVRAHLPTLVDELMADIGDHVEELVDLKDMVTRRLVTDKPLLNRLFLESGDKEFKFIVRSGAYFGFLFGLVQLGVWALYKGWWVLPLFGFLVGYATNWIALNLIFRPLNPVEIGPFTVHGLFLRRQKEVAVVWCRLVTREIVSVKNIIHNMLDGPHAARSRALIKAGMRGVVDEAVGVARGFARLAVGREGFEQIKEDVGDKAIEVSPEPFDDPVFVEERAAAVEELLRERMEGLPSEEFQDLLRPCFKEDEIILILVGAGLGLLAGVAQLFLVFGGIS